MILELVKFSNFVKYANEKNNIENLKNMYDNFICECILSNHNKFKDVFEKGKNSLIK